MSHLPPSPPGFYGWRIVWALAISTTVAYGVLYYSYTVFVKAMEQELAWSRAETSGAFGLAMLVAGLVAPVLGRVLDAQGARGVMSLGSVLAGLAVLAWSWVESLLGLYLVWALLGVTAAATFYDPAFTTIAVWFRRFRPQAMLTVTLVAGLASTIFVPLASWLLASLGWRGAVRVLALLMLACAPMLWLVLRQHPRDVGQTIDGVPELPPQSEHTSVEPLETLQNNADAPVVFWKTPIFWALASSFALARTAMSVLGPHLVPLLLERGMVPGQAALIPAAVGVLQLLGRSVLLPLMNSMPLVSLTAANFMVHGLGVLALLLAQYGFSLVFTGTFVVLYGASNGALTLTRAALIAELFDTSIYGRVNGVISLLVSVVGALMPVVAGVLHDQSGDYQSSLGLLVAVLALASLMMVRLGTSKPAAMRF
jgi:MFS family permease